jgi:hypothetical protein
MRGIKRDDWHDALVCSQEVEIKVLEIVEAVRSDVVAATMCAGARFASARWQ